MSLQPNQEILGAVQEGECSEIDEVNPYAAEDKRKYLGWEAGHERMVAEIAQEEKWGNLSWYRKLRCRLGIHKYKMKRVRGRPHINPKLEGPSKIDGRDPVVKKYTCIFCGDVYFIGLGRF